MFRVIVVDDEERILNGVIDLYPWSNIGFEVIGKFLSAKDALDFLKKNQTDVVMTDISMPDMDGVQFTEEIRKISDAEIIYFSSYQDYQYMRAAIQFQVTDYLLKPIQYDEFIACFEKVRKRLEGEKKIDEDKNYYDEIVQKVDHYLSTNYRTATLSEAAQIVGLSPSYLSKIYKDKAGIGFLEKLNQVRMEKAAEMLKNPNYKAYEIAYYVGYDNPKNFSRAFKQYFNVNPHDFRNGKRE